MAYFNYFIRCIIRNISYKLCKPKVFLTVLLSIVILFGLKHFGYCAWEDTDLQVIMDGISTITNNQGTIISQLSSMGVDVSGMEWNLNTIRDILANIRNDTSSISSNLSIVLTKIESLNTTLLEISQKQDIFYEDVSKEIQTIRESLLGTESEPVSFENFGLVNNVNGFSGLLKVHIPMEYKYTYTVTVTYLNSGDSGIAVNYGQSSINASDNQYADITPIFLGGLDSGKTGTFTFSTRDYRKEYFYFFYGFYVQDIKVERSIEGIVDVIDRTNQNINNSLNENNQLQQEQNQLQQEQNDFLKDDNITVDSSTLPSDTSQDITEDGFNSIFQQIYNTFTGGSAQDIVITIPFTNKSFTINANTVYGGSNLGFIRTLIEAFWYFVISYFIVQDIGKKINKIKSGDIEHVQEDNIKEDLL